MTFATSPRIGRRAAVLAAGAAILCLAANASAQHGAPPLSRFIDVQPLSAVDLIIVPAIDANALQAASRKAARKNVPLEGASPHELDVSVAERGTWDVLEDGRRLWRLRIESPGSTDLNFGFSDYKMPAGATLYVWSEIDGYFRGPFGANDNRVHQQLWTPVIPGENAVIELLIPENVKFEPQFRLTHVGRGYLDMFHLSTVAEINSGSCNNDVICFIVS